MQTLASQPPHQISDLLPLFEYLNPFARLRTLFKSAPLLFLSSILIESLASHSTSKNTLPQTISV